jgi:hypothetical protein
MEGFAFTLTRDTNNTGLITIARTPGATATIVTRTNISGTGGIIGTITIGIDGSPGALQELVVEATERQRVPD